MVPAVIIKSDCLGLALNTSEPNLEMSKLDALVDIISIPQHDVAKVSGQIEFDLAQLYTVSIAVKIIFIYISYCHFNAPFLQA